MGHVLKARAIDTSRRIYCHKPTKDDRWFTTKIRNNLEFNPTILSKTEFGWRSYGPSKVWVIIESD